MQNPVAIIGSQFPKIVIPLVQNAKKSIRVIIFDWRWYPIVGGSSVSQFNSAVVSAVTRGVSVRALVNNNAVAERLKSHGCEARLSYSKKMLHTKMLLIDDTLLVIGSHNYTQHGFELNDEASVLVDLEAVQNDFVTYFENLWGV
jgi:phosphatidylserine/phosphatidylglycerophosphate/cardiolipin synthase-like enzyme